MALDHKNLRSLNSSIDLSIIEVTQFVNRPVNNDASCTDWLMWPSSKRNNTATGTSLMKYGILIFKSEIFSKLYVMQRISNGYLYVKWVFVDFLQGIEISRWESVSNRPLWYTSLWVYESLSLFVPVPLQENKKATNIHDSITFNRWLTRQFIVRGCSHIISAKNGGFKTPSPHLVSQKSEIFPLLSHPSHKKSEIGQPLFFPCQKSYFIAFILI